MKKMLAMLILGASVALPAAAFAGEPGERGSDNYVDRSFQNQAPVVYTQPGSTDQGTIAGPGLSPSPIVDTSRENGNNR